MKKYLITTLLLTSVIIGASAYATTYLLQGWTYLPNSTWGAYSNLRVYEDDGTGPVFITESPRIYTVNQWVMQQLIFSTSNPTFIPYYEIFFGNASPGDELYVDNVYFGEISTNCCGNNVTEVGEDCDDGNVLSGDYCSDICLNEGGSFNTPSCGNGIVERYGNPTDEECDNRGEPNGNDSDGCTDWCTFTGSIYGISLCGDGIIGVGEECDDGEFATGIPPAADDGCTSSSLDIFTPPCSAQLTEYDCSVTHGENCYWEFGVGPCRVRPCRRVSAGFPYDDPEGDFGNTNYGLSICGNGRREPGEDCDDGNKASGDGCYGTENPGVNPPCTNEGSLYETLPPNIGPYQLVLTGNGSAPIDFTYIQAAAVDPISNFSVAGEAYLKVVKQTPLFQITQHTPQDNQTEVCMDQPVELITTQQIQETVPGSYIPKLSTRYAACVGGDNHGLHCTLPADCSTGGGVCVLNDNIVVYKMTGYCDGDSTVICTSSAECGADTCDYLDPTRNLASDGIFEFSDNLTAHFVPPAFGHCSGNDDLICETDTDCTGVGTCESYNNWWWPNAIYEVYVSIAPSTDLVYSINNEILNCSNEDSDNGMCEFTFTTSDHVCYAPRVIEIIPQDGQTVCRNASITTIFNQAMDTNSILDVNASGQYENFILTECPGDASTCPAVPNPANNLISDKVCQGGENNGLLCFKNDDCGFEGTCRTNGIQYLPHSESSEVRIGAYNYGYCGIASSNYGAICEDNTECTGFDCLSMGFLNYLEENRYYQMYVRGAPLGLLSEFGIPLGDYMTCTGGASNGQICGNDDDCGAGSCDIVGPDVVWTFRTNDNFCQCDKLDIEITRDSDEPILTYRDFYTCAGDSCSDDAANVANLPDMSGNQHIYTATCYDTSIPNQEPTQVTVDEYIWRDLDYQNVIVINEITPQGPSAYVTPYSKDGNAYVEVKAVTNIEGFGQTSATSQVDVTVFICENPWPTLDEFPFSDPQSINSSCDQIPAGSCPVLNFDLFYCRDNGGVGLSDDLPALETNPIVIGELGTKLKEYFFLNRSRSQGLLVDSQNGDETVGTYGDCFEFDETESWAGCLRAPGALPNGSSLVYSFDFPYEGDYQLNISSLNQFDPNGSSNYQPQDLSAFNVSHNFNVYLTQLGVESYVGTINAQATDQITTNSLQLLGVQPVSSEVRIEWLGECFGGDFHGYSCQDESVCDAGVVDGTCSAFYEDPDASPNTGDEFDANPFITEVSIGFGELLANDAIGVRVMQNPNNLNPYTWYISGITPDGQVCFEDDVAAPVSSQNLEAYWRFEEGSGITATDSTGNNNDGTLQNGVNWVEGFSRFSASFDNASNQYISVSPSVSLNNVNTEVTLAAWVNFADLSSDHTIFNRSMNGGNDALWFGFTPDWGGRSGLGFVLNDQQLLYEFDPSPPAPAEPVIRTSIWNHVAATWDGNFVKIYLNGDEVARSIITDPDIVNLTTGNFYIGADNAVSSFFNGVIDEARVYSRALAENEVSQLALVKPCRFNVPNRGTDITTVDGYQAVRDGRTVYVGATNLASGTLFTNIYLMSYNQDAAPQTIEIFNRLIKNWNFNNNTDILNARVCFLTQEPCTNDLECSLEENPLAQDSALVGFWPFAEGDGVRAADFSGENNNGTLQPLSSTTMWTYGRQSYGLQLNGSDEYVYVPNSNDLSVGSNESFTVALWANTGDRTLTQFEVLAQKRSNVVADGLPGWHLGVNDTTGEANFSIDDGPNNPAILGTKDMSDGNWHFVVGVRDTTLDELRIYVDGQEDNLAVSDTTTGSLSNSQDLRFGRNFQDASLANMFNGKLDEVMIFKRALSEEEIQAIFFSAGGGMCRSDKEKIIRDTKRYGDIRDIELFSKEYQVINGRYPTLDAGTYVARNTISVWPSWSQNLQSQLSQTQIYSTIGQGMPVDPINRIIGCSEPFNSTTCWNETNLSFACPLASYVYVYYTDLDTYFATTYFEYGGTGTWRDTATIPNIATFLTNICTNNFAISNVSDSDGDGVLDNVDNCPPSMCAIPTFCYNPTQDDFGDNDDIGDVCDPCPNDLNNDKDGDGICGDADNCANIYNPDQQDLDGDTYGDLCDNNCQGDTDSDNVCDEIDNCPNVYNPPPANPAVDCAGGAGAVNAEGQCDTDIIQDYVFGHQWPNGEWMGDACDPCTDVDADGRADIDSGARICQMDNCPATETCTGADPAGLCPTGHACCNPYQEDFDNDLIGFVCDYCIDVDGDGYGDDDGYGNSTHPFAGHNSECPGVIDASQDNCPSIYNPAQMDCDENGVGDACDVPLLDSDAAYDTDFAPGVCIEFPIEVLSDSSLFDDMVFWYRLDEGYTLSSEVKDYSENNYDAQFPCNTDGRCDGWCPSSCGIIDDPDCDPAGCCGNAMVEGIEDCDGGDEIVEVVFVFDTSGSMNDEATIFCSVIDMVVNTFPSDLVTYKVLGISEDFPTDWDLTCDDGYVLNEYAGNILYSDDPCSDGDCGKEHWAPAIADISRYEDWQSDLRAVVVLADEGPFGGNPWTTDDSLYLALSRDLAIENNVRTFILMASGYDPSYEAETSAAMVATGGQAVWLTGGDSMECVIYDVFRQFLCRSDCTLYPDCASGSCPDTICGLGEDCSSCIVDCGACVCGNSLEEAGESCDDGGTGGNFDWCSDSCCEAYYDSNISLRSDDKNDAGVDPLNPSNFPAGWYQAIVQEGGWTADDDASPECYNSLLTISYNDGVGYTITTAGDPTCFDERRDAEDNVESSDGFPSTKFYHNGGNLYVWLYDSDGDEGNNRGDLEYNIFECASGP